MIAYIKGEVNAIGEDHILIENQGLGYKVFCSALSLEEFNLKEECLVYTEMVVREDEISLYGFRSYKEQEMFQKLTSVTGIGPKNGLRILSVLTIDEIKYGIHNDDIKLLTQAPGVGKKTASRIILELKDKIDDHYLLQEETKEQRSEDYDFALEALVSLGYIEGDVQQALQALPPTLPIEELIKQAMKSLEKRG